MLNIKSLLLGNFRNFTDTTAIRLAPVTILTGPNGSGKSTVTRSLLFMKGLDTGKLPFRLRLDSGNNPFGSFDMITNNRSESKLLSIGYDLYNIILGEEVKVLMTLEKDGDFDAIVRNISISNNKTTLFDFSIEKGKIASRVGISYFYDKLKEIRKSKNLYTRLEHKFRDLKRESGSYKERPVSEKDGFDNGQVRIFRVDKDLRKKKILEYLGNQNITAEECRRLFYFYSNHPFPGGEDCKEDEHTLMIKKILADFHEDDILFDNKLLKRILDIPGEELNGASVKALLKSEFTDLYDCLMMLKSDSASQVISLLNMKSYCQWEKEFVENEMISFQRINGSGARKELSSAIEHHLQVILEESPFFRALTELSATREGFLQAYNNYRNLKTLSSFCGLVLEKILHDLGTDIEKALLISDPDNQKGINVDFSHPLHDQIRKYIENSPRDTFLEDWLKKFNICEKLSLDIPLKGLGYFPAIRKGNENIPLSGAGSGVKRLVMLLLNIANARQREGLRDFNEDPADYPRTIIIEAPETNLHSGWQSRFADMIIDARNRTGLNFLIETHSEHLIERLQCLASTGKIDKKDLAIYRIDNLCDGAPQLREVKSMDDLNLDDRGEDVSAMELFRLKKINKN